MLFHQNSDNWNQNEMVATDLDSYNNQWFALKLE